MPGWRPSFNPDHLYFVTTTAQNHRHLFKTDSVKRLLLDAFDWLRLTGRLKLYGFVIMPNHVHCLAQFEAASPLAAVVRDFKAHCANRLVRQLRAERNTAALDALAAIDNGDGKQHFSVWDEGYNAKDVVSDAFLLQKLEYIHNNPCQPHWQLAEAPVDYAWSSARFYLTDEPGIIPVDDVRKLLA
jgi:REP element-mobilizing transposase RayT